MGNDTIASNEEMQSYPGALEKHSNVHIYIGVCSLVRSKLYGS